MTRRKHRAGLEIRDHAGVELLGEGDTRTPAFERVIAAAGEDDRRRGVAEEVGGATDQVRRRLHRFRRAEARDVGQRRKFRQLRFLQPRVEVHVDGAARRRRRHLGRAQQRVVRRRYRRRLVVPLGERADQPALVRHRVDPVDPRPPPGRVPRARRAEDQHGHAVAPRVEDGHARVQEADVRVEDRAHHAAARLGVAVGDGDGALLVDARQHLRRLVAEVVHQAVVQPAEARARHQRDVRHLEPVQHAGDRVAAPDFGARRRRRGRFGNDGRDGVAGRHRSPPRVCERRQAYPRREASGKAATWCGRTSREARAAPGT